jgi:hypothetical protein
MRKILLQKIIVLPEFLSGESLANAQRLFDSLHRRGDIEQIESLLSTVRVLQYQQSFYALELHHLIAVAADYLQHHDVNVIVSKVGSKPQLMQQLLNTVSIQSINQRSVAALPSWHQSVADGYGIAPLFSMRQWSDILNKHRSSVYCRKTKTVTHPERSVVDIDSALKAIPFPLEDGK